MRITHAFGDNSNQVLYASPPAAQTTRTLHARRTLHAKTRTRTPRVSRIRAKPAHASTNRVRKAVMNDGEEVEWQEQWNGVMGASSDLSHQAGDVYAIRLMRL